MNELENRLATLFDVCMMLLFLGIILLHFAFSPLTVEPANEMGLVALIPIFGSTVSFGICWLIGTGARSARVAQGRSVARIRIAAEVEKVWVTEPGQVLSPGEMGLIKLGFQVAMVSQDGCTYECVTAIEVNREYDESSWVREEIQGGWLGSYVRDYVRDPQLFIQYSGR